MQTLYRPQIFHQLPLFIILVIIYSKLRRLTAIEREKIESELKDVEGFIDVKKKKEEIDKRLGKQIENDGHLMDIRPKIEETVKKAGYVTSKSKANKDNGNNPWVTWQR